MPVVEELQTRGCKLHVGHLMSWSCTHGMKTNNTKVEITARTLCECFTVLLHD